MLKQDLSEEEHDILLPFYLQVEPIFDQVTQTLG